MDELRMRLDQLKPLIKIDHLYEKRLPAIAFVVAASHPFPTVR
jgi:hypothetical protein